jgi:prepilin-type N-terminal cleavage/methylation domain-containing protein
VTHRRRPAARRLRGDEAFTLIELLIAMSILGLVMAAMAPGFYNALASATASGDRNTADGLAVTALQQMQAAPYADVGFYSSQTQAGACPTSNTVIIGTTVPTSGYVVTPTSTQTVGTMTYALSRCVDWANDNVAGCTDDIKQTQVVVSWPASEPRGTVVETSAVYPGGESSCAPISTTTTSPSTTVAVGPPGAPTGLTATVPTDSTGTNTVDLVWAAPTAGTAVDHYLVEYNTTGNFSSSSGYATTGAIANAPTTAAPYGVSGLTSGGTYYFQVVAVSSSGSVSSPAGPVTATTSEPTTSTTLGCSITQLVVSPTSAVVDSSGHLVGESSLSLAVNASAGCSGVSVSYTAGGGLTSSAVVGAGGQLTGTAGGASTVWAVGTDAFTVDVGGVAYSPRTQVLVSICQEKGSSGKC